MNPEMQSQKPDYSIFNSNELSRKVIHFSICVSTFFFSHYLSWWQGTLIGMLCLLLVFYADKNGWITYLKNVKRKSTGEYWMILGILLVFLMFKIVWQKNSQFADISYFTALFSLGVADPLSMFGRPIFNYLQTIPTLKRITSKLTLGGKTFTGTLIYITSSFLIGALAIWLYDSSIINNYRYWLLISYIILIGGVEFVSIWGLDNIFIPVLSFIFMYLTLV